ncbi:MAG: DUF1579 family protein [Salinivirgaceae bacterium]|nr:DUF1579 family protein [Salinivirgaceae bacterium]
MKTLFKIQIIFAALLLVTSNINAGELEDIIAKHIKAHGGIENWKNVESLTITGSFTGFSVSSEFTTIKKRPNLFKSEYRLGEFDITETYNGSTYWIIDPSLDIDFPRIMNSAEENVNLQKAEFCTPFFDYEKNGSKVEYQGEEVVEGVKVYKLQLTRKNGNNETWYLNAKTYLEFKMESVWADYASPLRQETFFDDFREVDKIILPFYIERSFSIRNRITEIEEVKINKTVDNYIFEMPLSKEISKIKNLEGNWSVIVEALTRRGMMRIDSTSSVINFSGNNLLQEKITYENYFKVNKLINWTYSSDSKNYRMSLYSDLTSKLYVLEGNFKNDTLVFDNKGIQFDTIDKNNKKYQQYSITNITDDSFLMEIASSQDKGETWRVREKLYYSRLK